LLTLRSATAARAQAEVTARADAQREAEARQAELRAIEHKAQIAAQVPALNAALEAHVDSATIVDLLDSEDWWQPFRAEFPVVRLVVRDAVLASRGPADAPDAEGDVVKAARRQLVASAQVTIAAQPYLLGAARLTDGDGDPVLVLGRAARPIAVAAVAAPAPLEQTLRMPWAGAGAIALVGLGLLFSRGRKTYTADPTGESPVVPIVHETTLRFGEPRNDVTDPGHAARAT
jgi:hypothetical protein